MIDENDFEKEMGDEIKIEKIWGPAGKEVKIARVCLFLISSLRLHRLTPLRLKGS